MSSSMMIESGILSVLDQQPPREAQVVKTDDDGLSVTTPKPNPRRISSTKWWALVLLYCACMLVGAIGGPLLQRLYYVHGGKRKWLGSWVQSAGFPVIFIYLVFLYFTKLGPKNMFFMDVKLVVSGAVLGTMAGAGGYMYSISLFYLPVSTSALLLSTQLAFTAVFAFLLVKQKFTFYSVNSVVVMILGAVVLALHINGDRPAGTSVGKYLIGFFVSLGAAAMGGLLLPLIELAYAKSSKPINYITVMQFLVVINLFATMFSSLGMLVNKDFQAISREARDYDLGEAKYYMVIVGVTIIWQVFSLGLVGVIHNTSSLFAGIYGALLLPFTEVAAVLAFHEKFTVEKGFSLALCLWGFTSYFIGEHKKTSKNKPIIEPGMS